MRTTVAPARQIIRGSPVGTKFATCEELGLAAKAGRAVRAQPALLPAHPPCVACRPPAASRRSVVDTALKIEQSIDVLDGLSRARRDRRNVGAVLAADRDTRQLKNCKWKCVRQSAGVFPIVLSERHAGTWRAARADSR